MEGRKEGRRKEGRKEKGRKEGKKGGRGNREIQDVICLTLYTAIILKFTYFTFMKGVIFLLKTSYIISSSSAFSDLHV